MIVSREDFRKYAERRYITESIPEFGDIRIRSLTERERSGLEASQLTEEGSWSREDSVHMRVRWIVLCVVDQEGERIFTDRDTPWLEQIDSAITNVLFDACRRHVGISDQDVESLLKNSETTEGDDSRSDSPQCSAA